MSQNTQRRRNALAMIRKVDEYIRDKKRQWKVSTTPALNIAIDFEDHVRISELLNIQKLLKAKEDSIVIVGKEDRGEKSRVAILNPIF